MAPPTRRPRPRTPASDGPGATRKGCEQIAEQFSLSALDGAACELGVSRETLARALATPESRERFTERYGIDDAELARAIRAGLLRAVDDAEEAGALNPLLAGAAARNDPQRPARPGDRTDPERAHAARRLQSFLGPAQGLLEEFLPISYFLIWNAGDLPGSSELPRRALPG